MLNLRDLFDFFIFGVANPNTLIKFRIDIDIHKMINGRTNHCTAKLLIVSGQITAATNKAHP